MASLGLIAVLCIWEIVSAIVGDEVTFPSVQSTARAFATHMVKPYPSNGDTIWMDALVSLRRIIIGFAIGTGIGVSIGSLMSLVRGLRELIEPVIEVIRPLPPLAFIPLLIVWLGIGEASKVTLVTVAVIVVMTVATVGAFDEVPSELANAARALGANRFQVLWSVELRAAVPGIVLGMRLAMGMSWTSIVAVEMIASNSGVGFLILTAGNYLDTKLIFAGLITIAAMGLALDAGLRLLLKAADPTRR